MRTNQRSHPAWGAVAGALAMLALASGAALAAIPATTAYHFSSHPMISGTVATVDDHQLVVDTDQGEQVALEMDSGTMAPRDLAPGMVMRVEFVALEDCRFYARRIMAIRSGMSTERHQAYANTLDRGESEARTSTYGGYRWDKPWRRDDADSRATLPRGIGEHSLGTVMTATPGTADYRFSTRPMVSGSVVMVNDHQLVVATDQGEQIRMVMDSRTMVPDEVAPGSVVRAEFSRMKDGRFYAKQIGWMRDGVAEREQAYAHTRDQDLALAQNQPDCGFVRMSGSTQTSALDRREPVVTPAPALAPGVPAVVVERPDVLPQTASNQPLLLLLGSCALGAAALVMAVRAFLAA